MSYRNTASGTAKEKQQAWKLKNKDKIRAYSKKSYSYEKKRAYYDAHKEQIKERNREYWYKNKDRWKDSSRNGWLKRKYGIDLEQYNELYIKQNGCCAICGIHQSEQKRVMATDHNHKTNKVRGLLCFECNTSLGKFRDNPEFLRKAISYLNAHQ